MIPPSPCAMTPLKELPTPTRVLKRLLDLALGSLLLLAALPVILLAAAAIRLETQGSPFFRQRRIGAGGKPFTIWKLRGMYVDARERFPQLYDYSGRSGLEFRFHDSVDPRVTRVGAFLRKTSIDELPNFFNVVRGEMSLVGPRPEIPEVLALYGEYRARYLSVKPGITCSSKVFGRDSLSKRETVEMDLAYIEAISMEGDLRLLWKTCEGVLLRRDVLDGRAAQTLAIEDEAAQP